MLLSKMNADMLLKCDEKIDSKQIEEMQKFKSDATKFSKQASHPYFKLVAVSLNDYDKEGEYNPGTNQMDIKFT